jgi:hypothetical protein
VDRTRQFIGISAVRFQCDRAAVERPNFFRNNGRRIVAREICEADVGTALGKPLDDPSADSPAPSRNHCSFASQAHDPSPVG